MFIPSSTIYSQKFADAPSNRHTSPGFHPGSSNFNPEEDLVLHQRFDTSSSAEDNEFHENHDQSE